MFQRLFEWRLAVAQLADESPYFVCPGDLLVDLARRPPTDVQSLLLIAMPLPPLLGDGTTTYAQMLLATVASALAEGDGNDDNGRESGGGGGGGGGGSSSSTEEVKEPRTVRDPNA